MKEAEQRLVADPFVFASAWRLKHTVQGSQRDKALGQFWKKVYQEPVHDDQRVFKEFALNDYLEASDELHDLEYPMRPWISWSSSTWERRSVAVSDGVTSLSVAKVGTGSVHPSRSHHVYTVGFSN
jgi:hypothetical protein